MLQRSFALNQKEKKMKLRLPWRLCPLAALTTVIGIHPALAQNAVASDPSTDSTLRISISPYTWLSGISGTTGVGPATGDINLKFGDLLQELHFAAMTAARVDFGRWHVTTDFMYSSVGEDTGPTGRFGTGVSIHTQSIIATIAAGYRLIDAPTWNLEAFAGLRGWDEMNRAILSGPRIGSVSVNFDRGWVDPIMGLQAGYRLTPKLDLVGAFDVGGFSVGSKFTAQVTAVARWQFTKSLSGFAGYRYLYVDYDKNSFLYNVSMHGPLIGATLSF